MKDTFDKLLKIYNTSLSTFEKNITGRMNHILNETEKIKTKNWNEIQMIYRVRNDIDALNVQFKNEIIKQMGSSSHVKSASDRLGKRAISDAVLFLSKRTQIWNDKLSNLKNGRIYNFNYTDALNRIEKYLKLHLNIVKACDISVSNFVNTNIKYEGDSITTIIKRVIKAEKDSVDNISSFTANSKNVMDIITNTDTCNEALRLEIMTALNKLQLEIVDFKNLQARATTPQQNELDDEDMISNSGSDLPLIYDEDYNTNTDLDVDMTTLMMPHLSEGDDKLVEEFKELKDTIYTLMDNLKFDVFFSRLDQSLKDLQSNLNAAHEEENTLKQLSEEERKEFRDTLTVYFENIERKINALGGLQQTNINDISNLSSNLLQTKNLLSTTQNTILQTIQDENIINSRFQTNLLANYGEFANFKDGLIKSIESSIAQISEENIGKNNQVITLVNELKGRMQNLENLDTTTNYVTLNMIDDIIKKFNTTNKDELETFLTTIIGESEKYHEEALAKLQEKYNKMFEADKTIIDQQYQLLLQQHQLLDQKLQGIDLHTDAINGLKDEIKLLNEKIISLENELSISQTTVHTNYTNLKEEFELKFNAQGKPSEELQAIQTKLTDIYNKIQEIQIQQAEIETKAEDQTEEDKTTQIILLEELKELNKQKEEYQNEFKLLNAKIDQFTTFTSLRFNSLEYTQRELADKMIELNALLAEQDTSKKLIEDYEKEKQRIEAEMKSISDELGLKESKLREFELNATKVDGSQQKRKIKIHTPSLYKKKGKFTTAAKPNAKGKTPLRLNHQGRQYFRDDGATTSRKSIHEPPKRLYMDTGV